MKAFLLSLFIILVLGSSKTSKRIPLRSIKHRDLINSPFLATYQTQNIGQYNNNPFILHFTYQDYSIYLGISLYSSNLILSNSCSIFPNVFFCTSNMNCNQGIPSTESLTSVYFTAASYTPLNFSSDFKLDDVWFSEYSSIKLVSSCTGEKFLNLPSYVSGMVGFGLGSGRVQANNFETDNTFTVYLTSNTAGEIIFGIDSDLMAGNYSLYYSNSEWMGFWSRLKLGTNGLNASNGYLSYI